MATIANNYYYLFLSLIITINFMCINNVSAYDVKPMQDFCVADPKHTQQINGIRFCKNPEQVTADNFYTTGLDHPSNKTDPVLKVAFKFVGIDVVPGLNTLGLTMVRMDFEPNGLYPPHSHPRATELIIMIEGQLEMGFVSPENDYKYYNKTLKKGDMFVIPPGLLHIGRNVGRVNASAYVVFNSQHPGFAVVTRSVFGASPPIDPNYLASAYQLNATIINTLQNKHWPV